MRCLTATATFFNCNFADLRRETWQSRRGEGWTMRDNDSVGLGNHLECVMSCVMLCVNV